MQLQNSRNSVVTSMRLGRCAPVVSRAPTVMYSQYSSCTARRPVSPQSDRLRAIASPTQNAGLPGSPGHLIASLRRGLRSAAGSSEKKRVFRLAACVSKARATVSFQRARNSSVSSSARPGAS